MWEGFRKDKGLRVRLGLQSCRTTVEQLQAGLFCLDNGHTIINNYNPSNIFAHA